MKTSKSHKPIDKKKLSGRNLTELEKRKQLSTVASQMIASYGSKGELNQKDWTNLPSRDRVYGILQKLLTLFFPGFRGNEIGVTNKLAIFVDHLVDDIYSQLREEIAKSLLQKSSKRQHALSVEIADTVTLEILEKIPKIRKLLIGDVEAAYEGDPAAASYDEIILSYPCIEAIATYRIAHELYLRKIPLIPRIMSEHAHSRTGIDIHPGAKIGTQFFIDHGTGVVIGETTVIGNNVKLYQGVTLGALSFKKDNGGRLLKGGKRHPTIEDNVVIYSGTTVLGGETKIGHDSVIGANVWITGTVPPLSKVTFGSPKLDVIKHEPRTG